MAGSDWIEIRTSHASNHRYVALRSMKHCAYKFILGMRSQVVNGRRVMVSRPPTEYMIDMWGDYEDGPMGCSYCNPPPVTHQARVTVKSSVGSPIPPVGENNPQELTERERIEANVT